MPTDIHALEIEFAKSPTLEACIPLCEAYLDAKRHMEAMVVCKKGIKGAPGDPRGRVMLARVYLDQGKLPKARQELNQVLQEFPGSGAGLELMGKLLLTQGNRDEAIGYFQRALQADANAQLARASLQQLGVAITAVNPQAAPPQAAPPQAAPPQAAPPQAAPSQAMPPQAAVIPPRVVSPIPGGAPAGAAVTQAPVSPKEQPQPGGADEAAPLEHVSDFFAPDTLGFSTDGSDIETAGPGRLTILGFVPKNTGSIKTTIGVVLLFLIVAAGVVVWQIVSAQNTRKISAMLKQVQVAIDQDRYTGYKKVLEVGQKILQIDSGHFDTLTAMAYANGVLGLEHKEPGALDKAKAMLAQAMSESDASTEYLVATKVLIAYGDKAFEKGLAEIKTLQGKGGSSPLFEMESLRLMAAAEPDAKATQTQVRRTVDSASSTRVYNFLGWYYYRNENYQSAEKNFDSALQLERNHPRALIGKGLAALDRGLGLKERSKDIDKDFKKVFVLEQELSKPGLALAYFARAQLRQWQQQEDAAEADFKKAFSLDPDNTMFFYRRGLAALAIGDSKRAVSFLTDAVAKEPSNGQFYLKLAKAQIQADLITNAEDALNRAEELLGKSTRAHFLRGELRLAQKRYDDAIASYEAIKLEDGPDAYSYAQAGVAKAMRLAGDKRKAVKFMEDFLAAAPAEIQTETQAALWCELGQVYESGHNKSKAIQSYQVGIEQYRYYAPCHYFLCRASGRGSEAKEACQAYLTLAPRGEYAAEAKRMTH